MSVIPNHKILAFATNAADVLLLLLTGDDVGAPISGDVGAPETVVDGIRAFKISMVACHERASAITLYGEEPCMLR